MAFSVKVNYDGLKLMAAELAVVSGRDYAYILKSEGASMIKIAARASPLAKVGQIRSQTTERFRAVVGPVGAIYVRKNGQVWFTGDASRADGVGSDGRDHGSDWMDHGNYMIFDAGPTRGWHVPDHIWAAYLATAGLFKIQLQAAIAEKTRRIGLERLSWLQLGDAMGVQLATVAPQGSLQEDKARGAVADGQQFKNGTALVQDSGPNWAIIVTNDSPVAIKRSGQSRLDLAINRRLRGFAIACDAGLLDDLTRRARRWPGIFVQAA